MPEKTLLGFADHGHIERAMPVDGGYAEAAIGEFKREDVDDGAMVARLQREGVDPFAASSNELLNRIREKCAS